MTTNSYKKLLAILLIITLIILGLIASMKVVSVSSLSKTDIAKNETSQSISPQPSYDCSPNTNCYLINGNDQNIRLQDETNLNFPITAGWETTVGEKLEWGASYEVMHPNYLSLYDEDSGSILLKKGDSIALSIWGIAPSSGSSNSLDELFLDSAQHDFYNIEKHQSYGLNDIIRVKRYFSNGHTYILAKYPHYFVWSHENWKNETDMDEFEPMFSSFNKYDYYFGGSKNGLIMIVLDNKILPRNIMLGILQNLNLTQK